MLVLPVDLDQLRRRLAQGAERGHAAVDPGPGPPLGGNRAGEDHLALGVALPPRTKRASTRPPTRPPAPCPGWPARRGPAAAPRRPASCPPRSPPSARSCRDRTRATGPRSRRGRGRAGRSARQGHGLRSASRRKRRMLPKVWGSLRTTRTGARRDPAGDGRARLEPPDVLAVDRRARRPGPARPRPRPPARRSARGCGRGRSAAPRASPPWRAGSGPGSARRRRGCRRSSPSGWRR